MASWTAKTAPILVLVALALPASASGQATRTWVSGVGDDFNPCSRTAPCKTWAGAISKTASGGEIDALDNGAFGVVTITKPITLDGGGHEAGVLAAGSNGVIVNVNPSVATVASDRVVLRNLDINGTGGGTTGANTGINGVRVIKGRSVKIVDTSIYNFTQAGVLYAPSNGNSRLYVQDSRIHDNAGAGVMVAPPSGGGARASVRKSQIDENGCGLAASSHGSNTAVTTNCGTNLAGAGGLAVISSKDNSITENTENAVLSNGASAIQRIARNEITGSNRGLRSLDGGAILSWGDNFIFGNTSGGVPNDGNATGGETKR